MPDQLWQVCNALRRQSRPCSQQRFLQVVYPPEPGTLKLGMQAIWWLESLVQLLCWLMPSLTSWRLLQTRPHMQVCRLTPPVPACELLLHSCRRRYQLTLLLTVRRKG